MGLRLPSYKPCGRDGHCPHGDEKEPCYGSVECRGEMCGEDDSDRDCVMQCEGHSFCHTIYHWEGYKPSPYGMDKDASTVEDDE